MSRGHGASRRRNYGPRQRELRQRQERPAAMDDLSDSVHQWPQRVSPDSAVLTSDRAPTGRLGAS